jgi:CRISPR/Cas system CSM-associated protein Csm3 (group 7 of RAMP superfamily)
MVHLSNHKGEPIIAGTSITGALRSRTHRILNLFHNAATTRQRINDLFGVFGKDLRVTENPSASRLLVEETVIEEPQFDLVQNRVAIDRFTGGAKDSALFNEQPVFGRNKDKTRLHVNLTIHNPKPQDIGLMLLLLKDLWTGDLPLGGEASVGRGRLRGQTVHMQYRHNENQQWETEKWRMVNDDGQLSVEGVTPDRLEKFVAAVRLGEEA